MLQISQRPLSASEADARLFVDREEETSAALRALELGFNVLVLGGPKSGRTSFLRHVERTAAAGGRHTAFVDAQTHPGSASIVQALRAALGGGSPANPIPSETTLTEADLAAMASTRGSPTTVFLDNLLPETAQIMFGRFRDVLWQFPHRWVVSGLVVRRSEYLEPPADSFFDSIIELGPLSEEDARSLLGSRVQAAGESDDARLLEGLVDRIVKVTGERTPGALLAMARDALLHGGDEGRLMELAALAGRSRALGRSHELLFRELEALAPVHAGDERLLRRLGYTRPRIVQLLKDLEGAGIVESRREGRRQVYYPNPGAERDR
jgi:DNA-binding transcriptional ArsR family regulator